MSWVGLHVECSEKLRDIILAELSVFPFSTFEETESGISAYCEQSDWDEEEIKQTLSRYDSCSYNIETIEKTNWNEEWEKNYDPIIISDRCIVRATFHEPTNLPYEIIINPKMSFGTGHHATTHLVLDYQLSLNHQDKKVLDVGCGTGVLAIMAHKRGATSIQAFDIEDWCVENSQENCALNNCSEIEVTQNEIQAIADKDFDIILANITKGVHLDQMTEYSNRLVDGGLIIMSGFYEYDVEDLIKAAQLEGMKFVESMTRNDWARLVCRKQ